MLAITQAFLERAAGKKGDIIGVFMEFLMFELFNSKLTHSLKALFNMQVGLGCARR